MKNWLVSLAVVGALVAPGVYAEGEAAGQAAPAAMVETPAPAVEVPAAEAAKEAPKKKQHHTKKKKKQGKKGHKCKNCPDKKKQVEASNETPAEKKIDEATELTNR